VTTRLESVCSRNRHIHCPAAGSKLVTLRDARVRDRTRAGQISNDSVTLILFSPIQFEFIFTLHL
jgi:hypothetical protein